MQLLKFAGVLWLLALVPCVQGADDSDKERALLRRLVDVAEQGYQAAEQAYAVGNGDSAEVLQWAERILEAKLELAERKEQLALLQAHVERLERLHKAAEALTQEGVAPANHGLVVEHKLLSARLRLLRAERK